MSALGNIVKSAVSAVNPLSMVGSVVQGAGSVISQAMQNKFNQQEADKQRQWSEEQTDKQNAWNLEMWNKTNEYNSPAEQVARMREAGLNPLYYGLDGSSANAVQAAQPLGYDRASMSNVDNPLNGLASTLLQGKALEKDIEVKNAQIDKLKADTAGVGLDNEWKDRTMDARVESETLKNEISKSQKQQIDAQKDKIYAEIKKTEAETDNEILKSLLIGAQTRVANAQADEIAALLPYKKNLMEAQTMAQKASAAASFANAAINNKLLEGGAIDAQIEKAKAEARDTQARAALDEFKASIHNGTYFNPENFDSTIGKYGATFFNSLFAAVSGLSEVIVGPISGIFK